MINKDTANSKEWKNKGRMVNGMVREIIRREVKEWCSEPIKTIKINFQGIDTSKETSDNSKNKDKSRTQNGIKRVNNGFLRQWQD